MRILVLSHLVPFPLDSGAKVRLYYTLRQLSSQHELHLLAFSRPSDQPASIDRLRNFCQTVRTVPIDRSRLFDLSHLLLSVLLRRSFLLSRNLQGAMFAAVEKAIRESGPFEAVHADQIWMAPYAVRARKLQEVPSLTVLDRHNALFRILSSLRHHSRSPARRIWLAVEERRLAREEWELVQRFDRVIWVNEADLRSFLGQVPGQEPNIPQGHHHLIPISTEPGDFLQTECLRHRVTFLGALHWPPNREAVEWFARVVWPAVFQRHPGAVFSVVGARPDQLSRRVARTSGVEILGYQRSLDRVLAETAVFVVPLRSGSGTRVKILDAWNHRLPVVSTTVGAEGLETTPGANILVADSAAAFGEAVCLLLQDRRKSRSLGHQGRETLVSHYDWRRNYVSWDRLYNEDSLRDRLPAQPHPGPPVRTASGTQRERTQYKTRHSGRVL